MAIKKVRRMSGTILGNEGSFSGGGGKLTGFPGMAFSNLLTRSPSSIPGRDLIHKTSTLLSRTALLNLWYTFS